MKVNSAPLLADAWVAYKEALNVAPSIIIVQVGGAYERVAQSLLEHGVELTRYRFEGDYYSLPNVVELLAQPSRPSWSRLLWAMSCRVARTLLLRGMSRPGSGACIVFAPLPTRRWQEGSIHLASCEDERRKFIETRIVRVGLVPASSVLA
ncbi:hypothetical protein [Dictyobacter kobayashii]|uniref:hypothetical protein n=1 Tax=Dictyobacter kobayashii TaxID=2014872 RepID=UPI001C3FEC2E|nr:hypothetical protein [Dictyobacter kobayashii]